MHFVGMETSHNFLSWNMEQFFKMEHALQRNVLLLAYSHPTPWSFQPLPLQLGEWKSLRYTI